MAPNVGASLDELTPWLFARTSGGVRWGLERTERLLAGADDPHRRFHSILIGGTNGKGSTAAFCDAALRADGRGRVGLYTSPHLVSFRERIRIDGAPVANDVLVEGAERLRPSIEREGATFFEATTALAFLIFAEAGVDIAVVEVGLGGRLDATNVLDPLVTAITNIARDHVEYLGEDLAGIAREKAGIFKAGVPAVTGAREAGMLQVLRESAAAVGTELQVLDDIASAVNIATSMEGTRFTLRSRNWGTHTVQVPLPGRHQSRNAVLAAEILALLPSELRPEWESVARGFAEAHWPGRLQLLKLRGTHFLLDVAHNPDGVDTLASAIDALDPVRPRVLVVSILKDKEWQRMLPPLLERTDAAIVTVPESAPAGRRWNAEEVAEWCRTEAGVAPRVIPDLGEAISRAMTLAPHGTVIVTGSVHTVGDALGILNFEF
jgi:dihydrofolate synthase / folylpolyglutamate synthase